MPLMKRPLAWLALCYGAGVACGVLWFAGGIAPAVPLTGFAVLCALAAWFPGKVADGEPRPLGSRAVCCCAAALLLGMGAGTSAGHLSPELPRAGATVTGVVCEQPFVYDDGQAYAVTLRDVSAEGRPIGRGRVSLSVYNLDDIGTGRFPKPGDIVNANARLITPSRPSNPGQPDARMSALMRGVALTGWAPEVSVVGRASLTLGERALTTRSLIEERIGRLLPGYEGDALKTLLVGSRAELDDLRSDLADAGAVHVLSVSGLHVAFAALALTLVLRVMRVPKLAAGGLCAIGVWGYAWLVGFMPPVTRSAVMITVACAAMVSGRRVDGVSQLAAAFLTILLVHPLELFSPGFQMSFSSVLGLVLLGEPIARVLHRKGLPLSFARVLGASPAAQAGVTPFLLRLYGRSPLISLAANLPIVPVSGAAVLAGIAMLALSFCGLNIPAAGAAYVAAGLIRALTLLAGLFASIRLTPWMAGLCVSALAAFLLRPTGVRSLALSLAAGSAAFALGVLGEGVPGAFGPFPIRAASLTAPGTLALAGCLAWLALGQPRFTPDGRVRMAVHAACASALVLAAAIGGWMYRADGLTVTFLDVGQGDGALLRTPDGTAHIVDAGPTGTNALTGALTFYGARVNTAFVSHAHDDHAGGLLRVIEECGASRIVLPRYMPLDDIDDGFYGAIAAARERGIEIIPAAAGDVFDLGGGVTARVLWPETLLPGDANDACLVLELAHAGRTVIMTGDITSAQEPFILPGHADILKVAHHGSRGSTSPGFLSRVSPDYAVISVGAGNIYGHPSLFALDRLEAANAVVLRTDHSGTVTARLRQGGVEIGTYGNTAGVFRPPPGK